MALLTFPFKAWILPFQPQWLQLHYSQTKKILIGGDFSFTVGDQMRRGAARLNVDGSLDLSFQNPNVNGTLGVISMVLQPNGKIIISGAFSAVAGITRNNAARLNVDGTLDAPHHLYRQFL